MTIVSISLNDRILEEIDNIQKALGFSGRSETIRAGVRMLVNDSREKEELTGEINCVLLTIHGKDVENVVSDIKHRFEDITRTQIHSHLRDDKCLEIFILNGQARRVKDMLRSFQANKKIEYAKLIAA